MSSRKKRSRGGPRRYTDEQRAEAMDLYRREGPRAAAAKTGIPRGTIAGWARRAGVSTDVRSVTEAATRAAQAKAELLRTQLRPLLLAKALDLWHRMDQPHIEFKGGGSDHEPWQVTYPLPSPSGVLAYATAIGILIDKYRLENGESTDRQQVHVSGHLTLKTLTDEDIDVALSRILSRVPSSRVVVGDSESKRDPASLPPPTRG